MMPDERDPAERRVAEFFFPAGTVRHVLAHVPVPQPETVLLSITVMPQPNSPYQPVFQVTRTMRALEAAPGTYSQALETRPHVATVAATVFMNDKDAAAFHEGRKSREQLEIELFGPSL